MEIENKTRLRQGAFVAMAASAIMFDLWRHAPSTRTPLAAATASATSAREIVTTRVDEASQPTRVDADSNRPKNAPDALVAVQTPDEAPALVSADGTPEEIVAEAESVEVETPEPYAAAASCKKIVPDNGALLMGGWPRPDGSHAFALVTPARDPVSAPAGVNLSITCFSVSPEAIDDAEWAGFVDTKASGLFNKGIVFDQAQLAQFDERHQNAFPNMVMAGLTTEHGQYASISLGGPADGFALSVVSKRGGSPGETELAVSIAEYQGFKGVHEAGD